MKFELFERVAFAIDLPEEGIRKGDVATIVEYFGDPRPGYALEIFNAVGKTVGVVAVPETSLEPLSDDENFCAQSKSRSLTKHPTDLLSVFGFL